MHAQPTTRATAINPLTIIEELLDLIIRWKILNVTYILKILCLLLVFNFLLAV